MDKDSVLSFLGEYKYLIGAAVASVLSLKLLRRFFVGGVCLSEAILDGKTVIITGANTGIGKETARDLAGRGARVILACRNAKKANAAAEEIRGSTGNPNVIVMILDLASLKSVREFSNEVLTNEPKIHILINNAAVGACPLTKTEDGFEMQFGTNHLGHFLLTNLLLDRIKESAPARIVVVSAKAHFHSSGLDFENLNAEKSYSSFVAYMNSKLANILFTRELSKRLQGTGVTINSLHPGVIPTELGRHFGRWLRILQTLLFPILRMTLKTRVQGAQTTIYCAVSEELNDVSGKYFSDCAIQEVSEAAQDDATAKKLWELSEKLVGLKS